MPDFRLTDYVQQQRDAGGAVYVEMYGKKLLLTVHKVDGAGLVSNRGRCGSCYSMLRKRYETETYAASKTVRIRHRFYHPCTSKVCDTKIVLNPWQIDG